VTELVDRAMRLLQADPLRAFALVILLLALVIWLRVYIHSSR